LSALADVVGRKRNASATRAALLAAATARFSRDGYDSVSLREIAADAGVDVALVSRYFGGKEELFTAVLNTCSAPDELFAGSVEGWGERISRMLVEDDDDDNKMEVILIILRSASSPRAAEAIRKSGEQRFFGPFEAWLGGPNARERVRVAAGIIKGVAIDRKIAGDFGLDPEERERFRKRLASVLQAAITP
jgi:AcrR family transcriptional regulator